MSNSIDDRQQIVTIQKSHFHMMPDITLDELDPYEYRLFGHYLRGTLAGNREFQQGVRATADACQMSKTKVTDARNGLNKKGYISVTDDGIASNALHIEVLINNIWIRNQMAYADDESLKVMYSEMLEWAFSSGKIAEILQNAVSQIWDSSVPNIGQSVPNIGQTVPDSGQLIDISSIDILLNSLRELLTSETPQDDDNSQDESDTQDDDIPENHTAPEEQNAPKKQKRYNALKANNLTGADMKGIYQGDEDTTTLPDKVTEVELAIRAEFPTFILTAQHRQELQKKVRVNMEGHVQVHPSPNELYQTDVMFKRFIEQRLKMFSAMKSKAPVTAHNIVKNLVAYGKVNENKPAWNGWILWKKEQDAITDAASTDNAPVVQIEASNSDPVPSFLQQES